jgi:hypothetical protein
MLANPEEMRRRLSTLSGIPYLSLLFGTRSEALDKLTQYLTEAVARLREAPLPAPRTRWRLAEGYEGIQDAQVVVVNVGNGGHPQAEAMLRDLRRLRADKAVFDDIFGWKGKRTPITAVAADLADPRDPGLRKAIARIKRALPSRT